MKNPFEGKEIWFLTGSQGLYGEETLRQVETQSREVVELLNASPAVPAPIVWKPTLTDREAIRSAMIDANSAENCLGVIVWMHTFSPAKMWILGLEALAKPLLHLHTQHNVAMPWGTIDMDYMNLNQSAHGDREFGYIAARLGLPHPIVVGHASDERVRAEVGTWVRAAAGRHELLHSSLVRFGDNMRNVAVTEGDKTEAEIKLGVSVNTWPVNELAEAVEAVAEADVDALVATYEELYDVVPELARGGERHESLRYGARQELALRSFLEAHDATAFTTNFEDLGPLRQLPGLAVQRLTADGYGFGAEGDWKTAILVRVAKVMGYGLPGGASLMEDYHYELTPGKEKILGAHMLEVCPSLTTGRPRLEIHPLGIGAREDPVRLVFDADPGRGIVVAMADLRDRFRLTANTVEIVGPDEPLTSLPVASAVWRPDPDFVTSATCWLRSGAAHHTVMTTAATLGTFEQLAEMAGIELAVIDSSTTVHGFAEQLRLNQIYWRLNQPL